MNQEASRLEELKKKMTPAQRKEMSDLIENELRARQSAKARGAAQGGAITSSVPSSRLGQGLPPEQITEVYQDVHKKMQQSRVEKLEQELKKKKRKEALVAMLKSGAQTASTGRGALSGRTALLVGAIGFLALLKVLLSTGVVADASIGKRAMSNGESQLKMVQPETIADTAPPVSAVEETPMFLNGVTSPVDRQMLMELDNRRVELERRRESLDERELGLKKQEEEIATRIAELKSLTMKVSEYRKERDHKQEARLEQLANVYGSMAPNEASAIIARLDETISLPLLERLPEKRLGQILSSMDQQRAIEITKKLTERRTND